MFERDDALITFVDGLLAIIAVEISKQKAQEIAVKYNETYLYIIKRKMYAI